MLQYSRSPAVGQATSRNNRGYSENLKLQIQFPSHLQRSTAHCIFFPFLLFLTFLPCLTLGEFEAFLTTCDIGKSLCLVSFRSTVEAVKDSPSSQSSALFSSSLSAFQASFSSSLLCSQHRPSAFPIPPFRLRTSLLLRNCREPKRLITCDRDRE